VAGGPTAGKEFTMLDRHTERAAAIDKVLDAVRGWVTRQTVVLRRRARGPGRRRCCGYAVVAAIGQAGDSIAG